MSAVLLLSMFGILAGLQASGPTGMLPGRGEPDCFEKLFCISSEQHGDTVDVFVSNLMPWEFTMSMDLDLENMQANTALPVVRSYPARGRTQVLSLTVDRQDRSWTYRFDLRWMLGSIAARHDSDYSYALPFRKGESHLVGQSYNGAETHRGKFAIDWDMPVNTEVHAARGGVVVDLRESFVEGGLDPALKTQANFVKVRHADGTIGHYVHLSHNGVRVHVGDRIKRGDFIAYSGNTGYSSGPHLHFEVYAVTRDLTRETIKIKYEAGGQSTDRLQAGRYYGH